MIDLHCHIDLYPEPGKVVAEAVRKKCCVLAVTTTPLAWRGTMRLILGAPRVQAGLGLHPELVKERAQEVTQLVELLPEARFIGEIGLDGSPRNRPYLSLQARVFAKILRAAADAGGRAMSIHSKGAAKETLDVLEQNLGANTPVLHWYSGSLRNLRRAIELGCWFSVGPTMLKSKNGRKLASLMPIDRVLTETDGPFTRNGSEPLYPWDAVEAEHELGKIWQIDATATRRRIRGNMLSLMDQADLP